MLPVVVLQEAVELVVKPVVVVRGKLADLCQQEVVVTAILVDQEVLAEVAVDRVVDRVKVKGQVKAVDMVAEVVTEVAMVEV